MHSALYQGSVTHVRRRAPARAFRYPLYMLYLDLDELEGLELAPVLGVEAFGLCSFRRADYRGPRSRPLRDVVLDDVEQALGIRPDGAVRLLAHVRSWGFAFNPVSFYYCFSRAGELGAVLAEITNTPWNERHAYVVPASQGGAAVSFGKAFHVSPFLPMEQRYVWRLAAPGERLSVEMRNEAAAPLPHGRMPCPEAPSARLDGVPGQAAEGDAETFRARLELARRPLTRVSLLRAMAAAPLVSQRALFLIYWQALRLWLERAPFHAHPKTRPCAAARTDA